MRAGKNADFLWWKIMKICMKLGIAVQKKVFEALRSFLLKNLFSIQNSYIHTFKNTFIYIYYYI